MEDNTQVTNTEPTVTKTYTEEEFQKALTKEVDRRVESGIQKGISTQRAKWEEEYQAKAQLTAEELAKKELEEKMQDLQGREAEINKRANRLSALDMLSEAGVPKTQREEALKLIVSSDKSVTDERVQSFINVFTNSKSEIETQIRSDLTKVTAPQVGGGDKVTSKADFDGMTYSERLEFKKSNPEEYKKFIQ